MIWLRDIMTENSTGKGDKNPPELCFERETIGTYAMKTMKARVESPALNAVQW